MKKLIAILVSVFTFVAMALFIVNSSASANQTATVPAAYTQHGWWNTAWNNETDSDQYTYRDYPITCNPNPVGRHFRVLFTYPEGATPAYLQGALTAGNVDNILARVNSIVPASAKYVTPNAAALETNYSPKWQTTGSGNNCTPVVTSVAIPAQHQVPAGSKSDGVLTDYLASLGYNNPDVKYLVMNQHLPANAPGFAGVADLDADPRPDPAVNLDNKGGDYFTVTAQKSEWEAWNYARVVIMRNISHEMAHSLGASQFSSPNFLAGFHVSDCWDILCYAPPTSGQTYDNNCGPQNGYRNIEPYDLSINTRAAARWDCNRDDYFNTDPTPGSYLDTHWNLADSGFLWR